MTGFELEFTAPCPLGHAATWREQADTISAPSRLLEVACPTCDGTPPVPEEPPLPPLEALAATIPSLDKLDLRFAGRSGHGSHS